MIVELIRDISNLRWTKLKIDKPKNTLSRASYDVKESSGSIGWKIGTERTLSMNPKEGSL